MLKTFKQFVTEHFTDNNALTAPNSHDIALAAEGTDICDHMFDGDAPHGAAQAELDFTKTFAFKDFTFC